MRVLVVKTEVSDQLFSVGAALIVFDVLLSVLHVSDGDFRPCRLAAAAVALAELMLHP